MHITSAILLDNGQISNIHGSIFKIVVQLTLPKLTSPCFLQLEGTRGVVNDLNIVFECKKLVLGHKTQKFMILTWYWVGIVFYPITVESHFGDKLGKTFPSFLQLKATNGIVSE